LKGPEHGTRIVQHSHEEYYSEYYHEAADITNDSSWE
jgi:hypothetical protein